MDASGSEWSSGCESGWTVYLDDSSLFSNRYERATTDVNHRHDRSWRANYEDEEEDLSMVSDASSGPRHNFHEEEEEDDDEEQEDACNGRHGGFYNRHVSSSSFSNKGERRKTKGKDQRGKYPNQQQSSYNLDDTASSPALTYSKRHVDSSNNQPSYFGLSSAEFKVHLCSSQGTSERDNQFRFWHSSNPKRPD